MRCHAAILRLVSPLVAHLLEPFDNVQVLFCAIGRIAPKIQPPSGASDSMRLYPPKSIGEDVIRQMVSECLVIP